ncbi:MAG: glycosyltransferase family 2 protein [Algoriphagus sp.]|uniref:glycosyltransferase family A protein n=1 Tax=Algoriphagus sp. TaxID=1872435 RepID=UPI0017EE93E1|nr:glycosyltransferase family A protein [Algoriphagus sp.]NVJ86763.1 glycosyltransferase family 2 protein [Algoriphagus sp.]
MRRGSNPILNSKILKKECYHRIVIPVYIPNLEGYYAESLDILKLSLNSLVNTVHKKTCITVIDNNSSIEVKYFLQELLSSGRIDQLITYSKNQGKVDPLVSFLKGCHENLITLTDADVLFTPNWQSSVENLFAAFPQAGMVSPLAAPSLHSFCTSFTWFYGLFKFRVYRDTNEDVSSLIKFHESINRERQLNEYEKRPFFIENKKARAVLGNGHFCATICKEVVPFIPLEFSGPNFKAAEERFIDLPVVKAGFMRIATEKGYVFHLGNSVESWMNSYVISKDDFHEVTTGIPPRKRWFNSIWINYFIRRIFSQSFLLKIFMYRIN